METKKQVYEVTLKTSDEELDGEGFLQNAIRYILDHQEVLGKKEHIKDIEVNTIINEWQDK